MGNLKSNKTKEEWDDLVDKSQSHSDQVIDIMNIEKLIEKASEDFEYTGGAYGFKAGAKWMMENIKINFRRVR